MMQATFNRNFLWTSLKTFYNLCVLTCELFVLCLFFKSAFINYLTYKTLLHSVEVYIQRKILIEGIYNVYVITTKVKGVLRKTKRILQIKLWKNSLQIWILICYPRSCILRDFAWLRKRRYWTICIVQMFCVYKKY